MNEALAKALRDEITSSGENQASVTTGDVGRGATCAVVCESHAHLLRAVAEIAYEAGLDHNRPGASEFGGSDSLMEGLREEIVFGRHVETGELVAY